MRISDWSSDVCSSDLVLIEHRHDFAWLGQMAARRLRLFLKLFTDDVIAKLYAFIADEYAWPRDQLAHLVLALATKRAVEDFAAVAGSALAFFGHATWP